VWISFSAFWVIYEHTHHKVGSIRLEIRTLARYRIPVYQYIRLTKRDKVSLTLFW